uniref:Uncharacterized protein n=1 Tax=Anguilla anguilla TaxID=7936 RepID=A0A0E9RGW2_ANGAN
MKCHYYRECWKHTNHSIGTSSCTVLPIVTKARQLVCIKG